MNTAAELHKLVDMLRFRFGLNPPDVVEAQALPRALGAGSLEGTSASTVRPMSPKTLPPHFRSAPTSLHSRRSSPTCIVKATLPTTRRRR